MEIEHVDCFSVRLWSVSQFESLKKFANDNEPAILGEVNFDQLLLATWRHRQLENHAICNSDLGGKFPNIWAILMLMPARREKSLIKINKTESRYHLQTNWISWIFIESTRMLHDSNFHPSETSFVLFNNQIIITKRVLSIN